ncbi:conserved hypothetical protein [Culex quinquefasciatus]|uniref:Uncharacterized protein n=1 Tax=Culex quinquefasciatus TaxID=7176 RepID=B0X605_CULQU|nr:conserved hypothetical protein [Culex quinquefasciatus]|eukprot:XP_001865077.1 conserved hypothetical protein [Culex quinquefasciatus]
MDSLRIHTFYLDIRGIKKLKLENVYDFIADKLLLTEAEVAAIQPDLAESKVYVECHSLEKAEEVVRRFDGSQELVNNGEVHKIKLQMEDGATELEEDLWRRSETTIHQMQHEGQQLTEPAQIVEHVQQHFGRLFAREEIDQHTNFVPERRITNSRINDQLMDEIGEQEILTAIRASAPNKSPGRDGLTREFYLKMWPTIRIEITAILNEMKNGRMREDCTEGVTRAWVNNKGNAE